MQAVPQQVARAEVCAQGALTADCVGQPPHSAFVHDFAGHHRMVRRQHQQAAGGLGHGLLCMGQHPAHHGAAVYYFILRKGGAARKAQHLVHASAHRHAQHHGPGHCTAHGKVAVGHGFALQGARHIAEAFHIADHSAHLQGQAPLRHHSAQHFVDHDLFVAGGVKIAQFKNVHVRTVGHGLTHLPQSRRVLAFKADHAPLRARATVPRCGIPAGKGRS